MIATSLHWNLPDPSAPELQISAKNETHILVEWTRPRVSAGPIDGYEVSFSPDSSSLDSIQWIATDRETRSVTVDHLSTSTDYIVRVRAFNTDLDGRKLYSSTASSAVATEGEHCVHPNAYHYTWFMSDSCQTSLTFRSFPEVEKSTKTFPLGDVALGVVLCVFGVGAPFVILKIFPNILSRINL